MKKVLIYDALSASIVPLLERLNLEVIYTPNASPTEILDNLKSVQIAIGRTKLPIDETFLAAAPHLEIIVRAGAGLDDIDMEAAEAKGIKIINAPEGNRDAVGEHTLALLLALTHRIKEADAEIRQEVWLREENRFHEISSYTVGIIGFGNMGKAFAKRVLALGGQVIAYDKYLQESGMQEVPLVSIKEFQQRADVVSVHTPLNAETKGFLNADFFNALAKPIIFLNTARGKVVDSQSLIEQIKSGKVFAAGLDVWENEKFSTFNEQERQRYSEIIGLNHILFTPHIAGLSKQSLMRINEVIYEKLQKVLELEKI